MHYSWIAQISRFNLHTVLKNSIYCPKIVFWQNLLSEFLRRKIEYFSEFWCFSIYFLDKNTHLTHCGKETKWPFMQTQKRHFWEAVFNLSFYKFRGKPKMITFTKKTPIFDPFLELFHGLIGKICCSFRQFRKVQSHVRNVNSLMQHSVWKSP